jgi:hypothetical protein
MGLRMTYKLIGDDRSPKAYLDGAVELIEERLDQKEIAQLRVTGNTQRRLMGEASGLREARDILMDIIAGLE